MKRMSIFAAIVAVAASVISFSSEAFAQNAPKVLMIPREGMRQIWTS